MGMLPDLAVREGRGERLQRRARLGHHEDAARHGVQPVRLNRWCQNRLREPQALAGQPGEAPGARGVMTPGSRSRRHGRRPASAHAGSCMAVARSV